MELPLRVATKADANDIAALVNKAYRPSQDEAGWTHESHLLAFYQRRGHALTGDVGEYPIRAGVGLPVVAGIQVLSLSKPAENLSKRGQ